MTVEFPIRITEVLIAILAPTLNETEALATVVFRFPLNVLKPVTASEFARAAAPVILAVPEATRLEEIVSRPLVETFPPLRLVFATIVVAEKIPAS